MRCPFCGHEDSQVKDSRPTEDGAAIRRRRQCEGCGARFTTFERIQLREIDRASSPTAEREPFDREKLDRSIATACRKRPVEPMRMERLASGDPAPDRDQRRKRRCPRSRIGEMVMEGLKGARPRRLYPLRLRLQGLPRSQGLRGFRRHRV